MIYLGHCIHCKPCLQLGNLWTSHQFGFRRISQCLSVLRRSHARARQRSFNTPKICCHFPPDEANAKQHEATAQVQNRRTQKETCLLLVFRLSSLFHSWFILFPSPGWGKTFGNVRTESTEHALTCTCSNDF